MADGPHHYHPACGHKGSSHLSPVHALQLFYRDASSALLQLVNQWLNFTYSRSHAFRYERKNTNPTFGKNRTHDFRTSRCAAYLLDHSGDELHAPIAVCCSEGPDAFRFFFKHQTSFHITLHRSPELLVQKYRIPNLSLFWCPYMVIMLVDSITVGFFPILY